MDPTILPEKLEIGASLPRRVSMLVAFGVVGVLLVGLGFTANGQLAARLVLVIAGLVALGILPGLWRSTALRLVLEGGELRDSSGTRLCRLDQIDHVERGTFSLRPSGGFSLILNEKQPRGWVPGLWWRLGRRIGVGGLLQANQAKFLAEVIEVKRTNL